MSNAVMWPVVIVHGPPGGGKSTLARDLAGQTGLLYFDRDEFKDAIFETLGYSDRAWSMKVGDVSWRLTTMLVERLLQAGVPFIVETNFRPTDPIVPLMRQRALAAGTTICAIHVTAQDETLWQRFAARRATGGRHPGHAGFEDRQEFLTELHRRPHGRIDFGGPVLAVDTSDKWPDMAQIASWVRSQAATARADVE